MTSPLLIERCHQTRKISRLRMMPPRRQAHYQLTGEFVRKQEGEEKDERLRWIREFRDGDGQTASHPRPSVLRTDTGQCLRLLNPSPARATPRSASVAGSG